MQLKSDHQRFKLTRSSYGLMAVLQWIAFILGIVATLNNHIGLVGASKIGVCYGMLGSDLPAATEVVNLYKQYHIGKMRLFDPNQAAHEALRGSGIRVTVGIPNEDLADLARSQDAVNTWFNNNIAPYLHDIIFDYIAVGNEVIPGSLGNYVLPVMESLQNILKDKGNVTKVTTVVPSTALGSSYPPSSGEFTQEASSVMPDILKFLASTLSPLMINVYPYFAYKSEPAHVPLDYAQFTSDKPVVRDGNLMYFCLFDAIVDAFLAAMAKAGNGHVRVVVSESGWPSDGNGNFTTPELAMTYNQNFMYHCLSMEGTPKRPGEPIEAFIFAMFNENQKPKGEEQHFGLFYPNMEPVYYMPFT